MSEKWSQLGAKLFGEAEPKIDGTLAETYLVEGRKVRLTPWPEALRFHPAAPHPKLKRVFPALIAQVSGSDEPSFQFTYLAPDGRGKAPGLDKEDQRRTFGSNKGGAVFLVDHLDPGATLLTGEGAETVVSVMNATGLPGIAVLGVAGLVNVEFSSDVVELVLLGENDDASQKAIDKVAPSLVEKGLKVRVAYPPAGSSDFNDVIRADSLDRASALAIIKMIVGAANEWRPKRGAKAKGEKTERGSQASFLVGLAVARCELFCDPHGEAYATFPVETGGGTHREVHRVKSRGFNQYLRLRYYEERQGAPSSEGMASAIKTVMAKARFDGVVHDVYLRSANLGEKIYVDRCDPHWQTIEIDSDGFRVIDESPVYFRREPGMLPLPTPSTIAPKEGIKQLEKVLRLKDDRDLILIIAWLLAALAAKSPYTIIVFLGEPGSTKTSAAKAVRTIIDPNVSPLRTRPKDTHEVFVAAVHAHVVGYNNLSNLPDWLSDCLCVVSEGSGESRRELFSDFDESLLVACAPFLLTSIENVVRRGDLAQRAFFVHLASVSDKERLTEEEFHQRLRLAHADILGALCGAVAHGLKAEKTLKLDGLPRMASFYRWASACEGALWPKGIFAAAFDVNAQDATEDVIEGDKSVSEFRLFVTELGEWKGTATELLTALIAYVRRPVREAEAAHAQAVDSARAGGDRAEVERTAAALRVARETARDVTRDNWPKLPHQLSGRLRRASPALRKAGVEIIWPTRHGSAKILHVFAHHSEIGGEDASRASQASQSETTSSKTKDLDESAASEQGRRRTQADGSQVREGRGSVAGGASERAPAASSGEPSVEDAPRRGKTQAGPLPQDGASCANPLRAKGKETRPNSEDARDVSCGPTSGSESKKINTKPYPDEPCQGDGEGDEDDRPDGGRGFL
jgi:hypothetical protein